MWDESFGQKIANYLELMATLPNKASPERPDIINFDGGKKTIGTGVIEYRFSDGARAIWGTEREFGLAIYFATGEKVNIDVAPKICKTCGKEFWLGEVKKYCSQCGTKQ